MLSETTLNDEGAAAATAAPAARAVDGQGSRRAGTGLECDLRVLGRSISTVRTPCGETGAWSSESNAALVNTSLTTLLPHAEAADPAALADSLQVGRNSTCSIPGPLPSLATPHDRTSAHQGGHERRRRRPHVALARTRRKCLGRGPFVECDGDCHGTASGASQRTENTVVGRGSFANRASSWRAKGGVPGPRLVHIRKNVEIPGCLAIATENVIDQSLTSVTAGNGWKVQCVTTSSEPKVSKNPRDSKVK